MIAPAFDADDIMREVRAKANLSAPATIATLRQNMVERRNVANVATGAAPADEPKRRNVANVTTPPVSPAGAVFGEEMQAAILERAGLAADSVPAVYVDAWARLNCQKPARVSESQWRLALDDGGKFLDAWGDEAAALQWAPGELFDVASGIVWRIAGERVAALGADHAQLSDQRMLERDPPERDKISEPMSEARK